MAGVGFKIQNENSGFFSETRPPNRKGFRIVDRLGRREVPRFLLGCSQMEYLGRLSAEVFPCETLPTCPRRIERLRSGEILVDIAKGTQDQRNTYQCTRSPKSIILSTGLERRWKYASRSLTIGSLPAGGGELKRGRVIINIR